MNCTMREICISKRSHFTEPFYYENKYVKSVIGDVFGEDVLLFTLQVTLFPWLTNHLKEILHLLVQKV